MDSESSTPKTLWQTSHKPDGTDHHGGASNPRPTKKGQAMTEHDEYDEHPEDVTFRECMDYLKDEDIPQYIRRKVAGYFGTYGAQAWQRGLKTGVDAR